MDLVSKVGADVPEVHVFFQSFPMRIVNRLYRRDGIADVGWVAENSPVTRLHGGAAECHKAHGIWCIGRVISLEEATHD